MLRIALPMALGIALSEHYAPSFLICIILAVGLLVVLWLASKGGRRSHFKFFYPTLCLMWVALGASLPSFHTPSDPFPTSADSFVVRLCDTPRLTPKCYKSTAQVLSVGGIPTNGKILLYIRQDSASARLRYGDCLWVEAEPQHPHNWDPHFDYSRYLKRKGILWQCYVPTTHWRLVAHDNSSPLCGYSKALQLRMVERIRHSNLTSSQQGIAEALLLGWRDDVDEVTQRQFRDAGITHLLCVSGLHVGIVAWLAGAFLFFLGMKRWQRVLKGTVQLGVVWFFVMLTGMAPSTLRAGAMFSLLILGGMLQRQPNSFNNLCTSMWLLLLINPMLLFDIGFQLSYASVAGIIAWQRPLVQLLPSLASPQTPWYLWLPQKVWQLICLSTSAQMATLPLVLYHFHQFPLYFLIANLTVVPFAGVLLVTIMLLVLTGSGWITIILRSELVAVDRLTHWISSLPHAMLTDIYCNFAMALLITALLLDFTLLLYTRPVGSDYRRSIT